MKNKNGGFIEEFVVLVVVVGIIGLIIAACFIDHIGGTSSGQHTGYVTAIENNGIIWHTTTAFIKTDPQSSQEDKYCVMDSSVVAQLKKAADTRELITINYYEPVLVWSSECDHEGAIISSIQ